jgi:uncharacterized membrane protein YebE (DUF533 family)
MKKTKLVPVSNEVKEYLTQKISKPLSPKQMLAEALKKLKQSQTSK